MQPSTAATRTLVGLDPAYALKNVSNGVGLAESAVDSRAALATSVREVFMTVTPSMCPQHDEFVIAAWGEWKKIV